MILITKYNHTPSGIYEIANSVDGKRYIGSAVNLATRRARHFRDLRGGRHANSYLQNAWNKHGFASFRFNPLLICSKDDLLFYEQRAIESFRPEYNIYVTAGSPLGMKASQATKEKMSAAQRGRKLTPEWRKNIAIGNAGKIFSEEHRLNISRGKAGKPTGPISMERRAAISVGQTQSWKKNHKPRRPAGWKHTAESKAKMTATIKARWSMRKPPS